MFYIKIEWKKYPPEKSGPLPPCASLNLGKMKTPGFLGLPTAAVEAGYSGGGMNESVETITHLITNWLVLKSVRVAGLGSSKVKLLL